ncbi:AbrB/MazE/SpoVT family DNA-binding domain-containing protein [Sphingomonas sp. AP4-R1]|uniref:AbrB/MazE/SpoVT family DNA-binding domain-containing protein n=1 Tax=Sphingomonas sp. AP4-R1 TaxID=2735134 RepID=UPI0014932F3E|nr:AbrB/MazE/SpoVT family DNA-binding domain-containing protein [Sphingomonas sp. AP4-R1]QJU56763.1 AbrB/MazE/SpoVT family DNA-binding domain-containing protein [Sphingomonas sp. AP4-R1]
MSEEYRAKVFKSGNSLALRLPKALGLEEGAEMLLREERGRYIVEPVEKPKRKINLEKIWGIGKHLDLKPITPEDRVFEHRPLLWDDPEWVASVTKREP